MESLKLLGPKVLGVTYSHLVRGQTEDRHLNYATQFIGEPFVMMSLSLGIDVRDVVSIEASAGKYNEIVRDYRRHFPSLELVCRQMTL